MNEGNAMERHVNGWALGRFKDGPDLFAALVVGDRVIRLEPDQVVNGPATIRALLDDWERVRPVLAGLAAAAGPADGVPLASLRVAAPVEPRQIFQAGANYRTHVAEIIVSGREPGDTRSDDELRRVAEAIMDERARTGSPFFFAGLPAAICGPDDDVLLPPESAQVSEFVTGGGHALLTKPFTLKELGRKVRDTLDEPRPGSE